MKLKYTLLLMVLMMSAALVATGCGGSSNAVAPQETQEITLTATDIAYDLDNMDVQVGRPVRVSLQNEGALIHDFSISAIPLSGEAQAVEGMDGEHDMSMMADHEAMMAGMHGDSAVHVAAAPGATGTVDFTPSEAGTYEFYCTIEGHKEAGMVGTLVVTN